MKKGDAQKPADDLKMPADEFDRIMRGALGVPVSTEAAPNTELQHRTIRTWWKVVDISDDEPWPDDPLPFAFQADLESDVVALLGRAASIAEDVLKHEVKARQCHPLRPDGRKSYHVCGVVVGPFLDMECRVPALSSVPLHQQAWGDGHVLWTGRDLDRGESSGIPVVAASTQVRIRFPRK